MKKIIAIFLLFCVSASLHAQNTTYSSVQECVTDVLTYASKASDKNQVGLSKWFYSFANDSESQIDYSKGIVTIYSGCHFIGSNEAQTLLWKKMQAKLNQQISQQNTDQPSLYGDRASLICKYSDVTHRIDIDSCE